MQEGSRDINTGDSTPLNQDEDPLEDLSRADIVFARLLGVRARLADAVDAECKKTPEIAEELRQRFEDYSKKKAESQNKHSRGLARMLVERYSEELGNSLNDVRPPPSEPMLPKMEGRYDLKDELARGGMGAIVRTWDTVLSRELAMKVVLGHDNGDVPPERLRRFLREARVTAQLAHPGIVPVHELGSDADGNFFFTMRLIEGRDLRSVLRLSFQNKDGWNLTRALNVLLRVSDALSYAHSKGVVHRDIKPANVMVGAFGEVYLMDWGLAKLLGELDDEDAVQDLSPGSTSAGSSSDHSLTLEGAVVGTPSYMAPEQALGLEGEISPVTDVYAMGALLYQLLCGAAPFREKDKARPPAAVLESLRAGPPTPLEELIGSDQEELVAICEKAMNRKPADRFPTMEAFSDTVRDFLEAEQMAAEAARRARREAARAERISDYLGSLFRTHGGDAASLLRTSAWTVLKGGAEELLSGFKDQPLTRASLLASLSSILLDVDAPIRASGLLMEELALRKEHGAWPFPDLVTAYCKLARAHEIQNQLSTSEKVLQEALLLLEGQSDLEELRWQVQEQAANLLRIRGDLTGASEILEELASVYHNAGMMAPLCEILHQIAQVKTHEDDFQGASEVFDRAVELCNADSAFKAEKLSRIQRSQGLAALKSGSDPDSLRTAEAFFRNSIANAEKSHEPDARWTGLIKRDLALCLLRLGNIQEAEDLARESLVTVRRGLLPSHPEVGTTYASLAIIMFADGNVTEAQRLIAEAESLIDLSALNGRMRVQALETCATLRALSGDHFAAGFILGELKNEDESEAVRRNRTLNLVQACRDAGIGGVEHHYPASAPQ